MESKKSNSKISDIVSLQRILKKWKRIATTSSTSTTKPPAAATTTTTATTSSSKSIKFIKRTFSFTDVSATAAGYVAVSVGREEMKRYVVPTEYLAHRAFGLLLREAEEEFGFQHEGVLRIPCDVDAFEEILKVVRGKATASSDGDVDDRDENEHRGDHQFGFPASPVSCSPSTTASGDSDYSGVDQHYQHYQHHPQMCR
ncbi:Auxin-responsive protein SAUR40 [Linum grandiflorum]